MYTFIRILRNISVVVLFIFIMLNFRQCLTKKEPTTAKQRLGLGIALTTNCCCSLILIFGTQQENQAKEIFNLAFYAIATIFSIGLLMKTIIEISKKN